MTHGCFKWLGIIFCIMIALLCRPLSGLDPHTPVAGYLDDQWEISVVPPATAIISMAQTPEGYLWIATTTGLVRFDGVVFALVDFITGKIGKPKSCPMPDALWVDKDGTLWIGSSQGITSYRYGAEGQTGHFKTYISTDETWERIRCIKEDRDGNLWISFFSNYVKRFSAGKFTPFNPGHGLTAKKINAIVDDSRGNLLFASRENGVFIFKNERFTQAPITIPANRYLITLYEDKKGTLWMGTSNGLFRLTAQGMESFSTLDGLSDNYITAIRQDSDHNLWVGTMKGLNRLTLQADSAIRFESILKSDLVTCLFEDREQSLWVGTYVSGLKRLQNGKFIAYTTPPEWLGEQLLSLFEDNAHNIWVGTLGGKLFRVRERAVVETLRFPELADTGITSIAQDKNGDLWLATNGKGVFHKKNNALIPFTTSHGLADNLVTAIFCASSGHMWFSTFDGVSVWRNTTQGIESLTSANGLSGKVVHNVYEDRTGDIRITTDKGITLLKDGTWAKGNILHYLQGIAVTCIYEEPPVSAGQDTVYWIATHGAGLKRMCGATVTSYTTSIGLASDFIYQFFKAGSDSFWLMSKSGLLRLDKKELDDFANGFIQQINCTSYGNSDGMESTEFNNEFSRSSALHTRNGEMWWITKLGIAMVNPDQVKLDKNPPPVVIETVLFNNMPVPLHSKQEQDHVFNSAGDVRFYFTAPSFLSPEKIRFRYVLQGLNKQPVFLPASQERVAVYSALEPGRYTFLVTACNAEGVWNKNGASFSFRITPYFYQTLLFKAAIFLFLSGFAVLSYYLYKKHRLKKEEKYKSSPLNPTFADECVKKLNALMEVEKLYNDAEISLSFLADKLAISPHLLSQILNEKLNRKFSDYINMYRIEEVKRVLTTRQGAQQKIAAIAFDVGFNTTVAFYTAFKKYTGLTPVQYKKTIEKGVTTELHG